jgi:hypothetical protein
MSQTIKDKIQVATDCYLQGKPLLENGEIWSLFNDQGGDLPPGGILYRGEEIASEIASILFKGENGSRGITPSVYRAALRFFKMVHISAEPVYRIRALEDEGGEIRFTRGRNKKKRD